MKRTRGEDGKASPETAKRTMITQKLVNFQPQRRHRVDSKPHRRFPLLISSNIHPEVLPGSFPMAPFTGVIRQT